MSLGLSRVVVMKCCRGCSFPDWMNKHQRRQHEREGWMGETISHTVIFKFFPITNPYLSLSSYLTLPSSLSPPLTGYRTQRPGPGCRVQRSKWCADVTLWYVALCVWQGLCFPAAPLSIPGWKQRFSLLHKADCRTDGETWFAWGLRLYCMQILESLVSGDNPVLKAASPGRPLTWLWRKTLLLLFIFNSMYQQGKTQLHSLERVNRSNPSTIKPFYEIFYWLIWRSCSTCTVWPAWLLAALGLA